MLLSRYPRSFPYPIHSGQVWGQKIQFPAWLCCIPHRKIYKRLVQGEEDSCFDWPANIQDANPKENLWGILNEKKELSIKSWKTKANYYSRVGIGVTGDFSWFNQLVNRMNDRNKKCKRCYNIVLSVLIQFFKSVLIDEYFFFIQIAWRFGFSFFV